MEVAARLEVEKVREACDAVPAVFLKSMLQASRTLFTQQEISGFRGKKELVEKVGEETLGVGLKLFIAQLTFRTVEKWCAALRIKQVPQTFPSLLAAEKAQVDSKELDHHRAASPEQVRHMLFEHLKTEGLNRLWEEAPTQGEEEEEEEEEREAAPLELSCVELGIDAKDKPREELCRQVQDEVLLLGWEGLLNAQTVALLKELHDHWGLEVGDKDRKRDLVERLVVYVFDLPTFYESTSEAEPAADQQTTTTAFSATNGKHRQKEKQQREEEQEEEIEDEDDAEEVMNVIASPVGEELEAKERDKNNRRRRNNKATPNDKDMEVEEEKEEVTGTPTRSRSKAASYETVQDITPGLSLNQLLRFKSVILKEYCSDHGLSASGTKQTLSSNILASWNQSHQPSSSANTTPHKRKNRSDESTEPTANGSKTTTPAKRRKTTNKEEGEEETPNSTPRRSSATPKRTASRKSTSSRTSAAAATTTPKRLAKRTRSRGSSLATTPLRNEAQPQD
ncbi:hypothetical protein QOT17_023409 [Balamuthia mandrillaris]